MPGSITDRIQHDLNSQEHLVWRALRENGSAALEYLAEDCIMVLMDGTVLDAKKKPKPKDYLESSSFIPWLSYEIVDDHVVEIDLMAATIVYQVKAARIENGKKVNYNLMCSSTWRQRANANWYMCVHHQTSI